MSKTLSLPAKKPADDGVLISPAPVIGAEIPKAYTAESSPPAAAIPLYSADELRQMLADLGEPVRVIPPDPTMDLSIDDLPPHEIADKSLLPPVDERTSAPVQVAAGVYGKFGLNGIPLIAPGVDLNASINPATGQPYAQIGIRAPTQIQVAPMQFGRRLPR